MPGTDLDAYYHDGRGNMYDQDGDGVQTAADTIVEPERRKQERETTTETRAAPVVNLPTGLTTASAGLLQTTHLTTVLPPLRKEAPHSTPCLRNCSHHPCTLLSPRWRR